MWHVLDLQHGSRMGKRHPGVQAQARKKKIAKAQIQLAELRAQTRGADLQSFSNRVPKWTSPWKQDSTILVFRIFHSIPWHNDTTSCRIYHIVLTLVWHPLQIFEEGPTMQLPGLPSTAILDGKKSESQGRWLFIIISGVERFLEHEFKLQWWGPRCAWLWQVKRREMIWQMAYFLCLVLAEWSLNFQSGHWVLHRLWMGNF